MIMPLLTTDQLTNVKVTLTVPLVTKLLLDGHNQVQIAKMCNITKQSVNGYIKRNYDAIISNTDPSGKLLAIKNKIIANKCTDEIDKILSTDQFTKRDLTMLSVVNGVSTDKMRLLQGESTENISVKSNRNELKELDNQIAILEAKVLDM